MEPTEDDRFRDLSLIVHVLKVANVLAFAGMIGLVLLVVFARVLVMNPDAIDFLPRDVEAAVKNSIPDLIDYWMIIGLAVELALFAAGLLVTATLKDKGIPCESARRYLRTLPLWGMLMAPGAFVLYIIFGFPLMRML